MLHRINKKLFADFCVFSAAHIRSGDIDPMYPVLRRAYDAEALDAETRIWRTLLYVTWYHPGTADVAWAQWPGTPTSVFGNPKSTGIERRGFRGNLKCYDMLNAVLDISRRKYGGLEQWVSAHADKGWRSVRDSMEALPYCGPWASYKWADLTKHVLGYDITADDIGVGGGSATSGPVPGMVKITGEVWQRCASDVALQRELLYKATAQGVPFAGLDQLETCLCDFNSMHKGHYYVGHDIDHQQVQLSGCSPLLWQARSDSFDSRYRGEASGWQGVRKELCSVYRDSREVLL